MTDVVILPCQMFCHLVLCRVTQELTTSPPLSCFLFISNKGSVYLMGA